MFSHTESPRFSDNLWNQNYTQMQANILAFIEINRVRSWLNRFEHHILCQLQRFQSI